MYQLGSKLMYNKIKNCFQTPELIHVELTEKCPLRCPQCYCSLDGNDIEWELLESTVLSAKKLGVSHILLTGGEPLLYPHLNKCIELIHTQGIKCMISSSGFGLTESKVMEFYSKGLDRLYISLNGSTDYIHNISRDCYNEAIAAIKCIKSTGLWCGVNWVARKDNYLDFPELVHLCKGLNVDRIDILASKYSVGGKIDRLSSNELKQLAEYIKSYTDYCIHIELCYPELRNEIYGDKFHDIFNNCLSGKLFVDVHVDGSFSPCRHTRIRHEETSLYKYWKNSMLLQRFRDSKYVPACKYCLK